MIKVCHMTSAHRSTDVRVFKKECVSLAKAGYDVYLVAQGDSREENGVHVVGVEPVAGGRISRMTQGAKRVYEKALELDADVYHFHDAELFPYALKLKRKGKTVIFDSHEHTAVTILEKTWIPALFRTAIYVGYSWYEKYVCRRLDAIVTVTPDLTEFFKKINPCVTEITNYPMWQEDITMPTFVEKRFVFAGSIEAAWNHHRIIAAMERIPDSQYVICGLMDNAYHQQLQEMPAWSQVNFLGRIPHAEVAKVLASGSVGMALISPCRNTAWNYGTIGNTKIFEEMMAGLPVLCTNFVLWKAFVDRYQCGICVDPDNDAEIENALRYLIDHPEEARRMGENGRRAIKEEFNWGVEEKKLFALYEEIVKA